MRLLRRKHGHEFARRLFGVPLIWRALAVTSACALPVVLAAQSQKPGFQSSVTRVEVDIVVTDKSGLPMRGLRQEDFEIFEDDRIVDVATFSAIDVAAASPSLVPAAAQSGSAFASNDRIDAGRLMLIVLDDVQVGFTAGRTAIVKSIARRAVERLGPADLAGVMTTSGRRGGQAEFTTDKSRLLAAIERFVPVGGHELPSIATRLPSTVAGDPEVERIVERRTASAMAGLSTAARALGSIPHRRKGVLFISQGFPASLEQIVHDPLIGAAWESIREFMLTAQRHNVAVYTVDPCGLEADAGCNRMSRQNLRTIAEETGGLPWSIPMPRTRGSIECWPRTAPTISWGTTRRRRRMTASIIASRYGHECRTSRSARVKATMRRPDHARRRHPSTIAGEAVRVGDRGH